MIELMNSRLCSVENWSTCLDSKCPCLIPFNGIHYCALGYFGDQGPRTAWYDTEYDQLETGSRRPNNSYYLTILRPMECTRNQTESPSIVLSAEEKEAFIHDLHLKWIEYLRFHPEDSWLDVTMVAYPEDPPEQWPVVCIPVCRIQDDVIVEVYTTLRCFTPEVDNNGETPVFAHKGVLEFLLAHRIECVVGTIDRWNFKLDEQEGLPLSTMAAKMDIDIGKAFVFFVERFGGTLRAEQHGDWCLFQSD